MNYLSCTLASCALVLSSLVESSVLRIENFKLSDEQWLSECSQIKEKYSSQEHKFGTAVQFRLNDMKEIESFEKLELIDFQLPIIGDKGRLSSFYHLEDGYELKLKSENGSVLILRALAPDFIENFWGKSSSSTDSSNEEQGRKLTEAILGRKKNALDIVRDGFLITPQDIECTSTSRNLDSYRIITLANKIYRPAKNNSPLKVIDFETKNYRGYIEAGYRKNKRYLFATIYNDSIVYEFSYYLSELEAYLEAGLMRALFKDNGVNE